MSFTFPGDSKPYLDHAVISHKLLMFNLTYDWSLFDDVPESQHINVMYPDLITTFCATKAERVEQLLNCFGNELSDEEQQDIRDRYA